MSMNKPEVGKSRIMPIAPAIRSIDAEHRTITFAASTETVDRMGDIIRVGGWDYRNYMKNPVFLFGHNSRDLPVGKTIAIQVETNPPALVHTVQFAKKSEYEKADTVFKLYQGGYMSAVSVGFMPTKKPKMRIDPETEKFLGYEFDGQELLELSAVPVPANPDALARAVHKGVVTSDEARRAFGEAWENSEEPEYGTAINMSYEMEEGKDARASDNKESESMEKEHQEAAKPEIQENRIEAFDFSEEEKEMQEQFPDEDVESRSEELSEIVFEQLSRQNADIASLTETVKALNESVQSLISEKREEEDLREFEAEDKTAIPYHKESLDPKDAKWDAGAEFKKAQTASARKRMSTVIVGDAGNLTSYKLPHHRGDNFHTVWNGVRNALARFSQTQMPSEDKKGALAHLAKHRSEFMKQSGVDFNEQEFVDKFLILDEAYRSLKSVGHTEAAELWRDKMFAMAEISEEEAKSIREEDAGCVETKSKSLDELLSSLMKA